MRYPDYLAQFEKVSRGAKVTTYATVEELGRPWPLLRLETPGRRRCLITAGFHGEEPAGPLSVLDHVEQLLDFARARDVALTLYPCVNPSGFEGGHRYNASGEEPNNDFIRYVLADGEVVEEVEPGQAFARWLLYDGGPKETRALRADVAAQPLPHAALDLHQDAWLAEQCHYAYYFGDHARFAALIHQGARLVPVGAHVVVHDQHVTDADGLLLHHDGSITDYFHRRGVQWTAVLETSTATPRVASSGLNFEWMKAFVELAAEG